MKINSPAEDKIIVDLTKQDMLDLEITYEDMDYSTIETRRVIWTVLDEAGKALGRDFDPSRRMIIEAMPKNGGGCVLSFTILDGR
ncbi:MAG: adaptor protein MecA, partial [Clostridia bacterium]|nr:adaptor protein MecA [Clostridia bacterium]